ncbi:hypothetical protein K9N68_07460 [Kovacikia minuta CCNUW1]|uniref:hypothetical protein n=1 Tax=Kovacikia minuta TaxID=2931930 RepID=UPI001CCEA573|nr:hypothetical protein [Kovacikia minuta]UBF27742.1 hypothetical protein K9N68_07460 [Kovacikia minuta CCNUW1]
MLAVMNIPPQVSSQNRAFFPKVVDSSNVPFPITQGWLQRLGQICIQFFSPNDEPKVWQNIDRQGNTTSWQVFDPETGQSIRFGSEMEVRLWLEQRYYR